jgi:hypothetical protein
MGPEAGSSVVGSQAAVAMVGEAVVGPGQASDVQVERGSPGIEGVWHGAMVLSPGFSDGPEFEFHLCY